MSWLDDHTRDHANRVLGEMRTPWDRLPLGRTGTWLVLGAFAIFCVVRFADRIAHSGRSTTANEAASAAENTPANPHIDNSAGAF